MRLPKEWTKVWGSKKDNIVAATFRSFSDPTMQHLTMTITDGSDGFCSCRGFQHVSYCWHIRELRRAFVSK